MKLYFAILSLAFSNALFPMTTGLFPSVITVPNAVSTKTCIVIINNSKYPIILQSLDGLQSHLIKPRSPNKEMDAKLKLKITWGNRGIERIYNFLAHSADDQHIHCGKYSFSKQDKKVVIKVNKKCKLRVKKAIMHPQ